MSNGYPSDSTDAQWDCIKDLLVLVLPRADRWAIAVAASSTRSCISLVLVASGGCSPTISRHDQQFTSGSWRGAKTAPGTKCTQDLPPWPEPRDRWTFTGLALSAPTPRQTRPRTHRRLRPSLGHNRIHSHDAGPAPPQSRNTPTTHMDHI